MQFNIKKGGFLHSAIIVSLLLISAKLIGAVKEAVVAYRFGVSYELDIYLVILTATLIIPSVAWSVGTTVLVPKIIAARNEDRFSFESEIIFFYIILAIIVFAINLFFGDKLISLIGNYPEAIKPENYFEVILIFSIASFFFTLSSCFSILLQSKENYYFSFFECLPAASTIVYLAVSPASDIKTLAIAYLYGSFFQALVLAFMLKPGAPSLSTKNFDIWTSAINALLVLSVSQLVIAISQPLDQYFASMIGEGSVSLLSYSNRILSLHFAIFGTAIARVTIVPFSNISHSNKFTEIKNICTRYLLGIAVFSALLIIFNLLVAEDMVRVIYQRGSFEESDTRNVSMIFSFSQIQIPFVLFGALLVQACAAIGAYKYISASAIVGVVVKIAFSYFFLPGFGINGIVASTTLMFAASSCVLAYGVYSKK